MSCPYYSPRLYCTAICDGAQAVFSDFSLFRAAFFVVQRVACYEVGALVARHGRDRGACRRWEQGGVKGGFRSMQFPRRGLAVTYAVRPWELRRFHALRGIGFGKSGGVSKVSMGAISLSLVFLSLPLGDSLAADPQLLRDIFL